MLRHWVTPETIRSAIGVAGDQVSKTDFRGVSVTATSKQLVTTLAVGIEVAGNLAIAASTSINLLGTEGDHLTTQAYVGGDAALNQVNSDAHARQSINVFAHSNTKIVGAGGTLGLTTGENLGLGASADAGHVYKTTEAWLSAEVAHAANVITVQAYSDEHLVSVAGTIELSGSSNELAGALGVYLWELDTKAYIGSKTPGNGLAEPPATTVHAGGSVQVAANNDTTITFVEGSVAATTSGDFSAGASVNVNELIGTTQAYISDDAAVTALADDQTDTISAAVGGYDITFSDDVPNDGSTVAPLGSVPSAITGDGEISADDPAWTHTREATGRYEDIRGVAVTSNASERITSLVAAFGLSNAASADAGVFVPVTTRDTLAWVAGSVNREDGDVTGTGQDVVVTASTDYHALGMVFPLAAAQELAATVGVSWNSTNLTTQAYITADAALSAGGNVLVVAAASEHVTTLTVGISGSAGEPGGAWDASVTGLFLTSTTTAEIRERERCDIRSGHGRRQCIGFGSRRHRRDGPGRQRGRGHNRSRRRCGSRLRLYPY